MVIGGIKHFGDELRLAVVLHGAHVIALRKRLHIEIVHVARAPQAQHGNRVGIFAGNHHVVSDGLHFFRVHMIDDQPVFRPAFLDIPIKLHLESQIGSLRKPRFAAGKPDIGKFHLPAVHDLLFEKTVFIQNGIPHSGIVLTGKPV